MFLLFFPLIVIIFLLGISIVIWRVDYTVKCENGEESGITYTLCEKAKNYFYYALVCVVASIIINSILFVAMFAGNKGLSFTIQNALKFINFALLLLATCFLFYGDYYLYYHTGGYLTYRNNRVLLIISGIFLLIISMFNLFDIFKGINNLPVPETKTVKKI